MGYGTGEIGLTRRSRLPVELASLPPAEAQGLSERIAAMPPWSLYPYETVLIYRYLTGGTPEAPRYAIRVSGQLAGTLGLVLGWLRGPYVQMLAVLPEYQGEGIGALCLDWLEQQARAGAERNLWVCVSQFNTNAQRFYERAGFVRVGTLEGLVTDAQTELLMRKVLAPAPAPAILTKP